MRVFKHSDELQTDKVHWTDDDQLQVSSDYVEMPIHYHVQESTKDKHDYVITMHGKKYYYEFSSESGFKAFQEHKGIFKSTDLRAVNNPPCLTTNGQQDRLTKIEVENG